MRFAARWLAFFLAASALSGCGDRDTSDRVSREDSSVFAPYREEAAESQSGIDPLIDFARKPWTGDLDGMLKRRMVRILVVPSRTHYWLELGKHSGIEYELTHAFENWLNKQHKPSVRHLRTRFVYIPTTVDRLIPDLLNGHGDIAAAMLTVTPARASTLGRASRSSAVSPGTGRPRRKELMDERGGLPQEPAAPGSLCVGCLLRVQRGMPHLEVLPLECRWAEEILQQRDEDRHLPLGERVHRGRVLDEEG